MSRHRMARLPLLYASICLITLYFVPVAAVAYNLSSEFSEFVPACAQQCLLSFIKVNFAASVCGSSPSVDCLCAHVGASGYTIAEGAVQCIAAERAIGFCSKTEASDSVIQAAFRMCDGDPSAVQPTHSIITMTLVFPPSSEAGVITFPPITTTTTTTVPAHTASSVTTTTTSTESTTLPTTLLLDTSAPPAVPAASSHSTTSSRRTTTSSRSHSSAATLSTTVKSTAVSSDASSPTDATHTDPADETLASTTSTSTSTGTAAAAAAATGGRKLSNSQVAGISVGALAAAGVAIGAIVLARYYRRRNHPLVKTGFFPMRDTWGYKPEHSDSGGSSTWVAAVPDVQRPLQSHPPPPSYSRNSYKPEAIGFAVTPPASRGAVSVSGPSPMTTRPFSKLLPAKPILPVLPLGAKKRESRQDTNTRFFPPENLATSSSRSNPPAPALKVFNTSVSPPRSKPSPPRLQIPIPRTGDLMEQTSLQRGSTATEFEEDGALSAQVWRLPPTTPIAATTFYVADQHGNWRLADAKQTARLSRTLSSADSKMPSVEESSISGASKDSETVPERLKRELNQKELPKAPPIPQDAPRATLAPPAEITRSTSRSSSIYSQQSLLPRNPYPLFSSQPNPTLRRSTSVRRRSSTRNLIAKPRVVSTDSGVTTFTTDSEDTVIEASSPVLADQGVNLSPVAESPSPAKQPKIPTRDPRRISGMTSPVNGPRNSSQSFQVRMSNPPVMPSPAVQQQMSASGGLQPVLQSSSRVVENPGLDTTGSPTMRVVDPSPEPDSVKSSQTSTTTVPAPGVVVSPPEARAPAFFIAPPYPQPLNPQRAPSEANFNPPRQPPPQQQYRQPFFNPQRSSQQYSQYAASQRSYPQRVQPQYPGGLPARPYPQRYPDPYSQQQQQPRPPNQAPRYQQQQPPQQQQQQPYYESRPYPRYAHPPGPYRTPPPDLDPPAGPGRTSNPSSTSSSLLAKRVGSDRAAGMAIPTAPGEAQPSRWTRDDWTPVTPGRRSGQGWMPMLTPSRRGDDLYLDVQ